MERPTRFEHNRYVGDKRRQVLYDLDNTDEAVEAAVNELMEAETYLCFGPDTVAEARNRGYKLATVSRRARQAAGIDDDVADTDAA